MRTRKSGKWVLLAVLMVLAVSLCAACAGRMTPNNAGGTHVIKGYIVDYNNDRVTVDEVEFLTTSNTNRITELGLDTNRDFQNGYYIHDDGRSDRKTYTLSPDVQVRFADTVGRTGNAGMGINTSANTNTPTNPNHGQHEGYTLGGTVGGTLGGLDMLNSRFRDGVNQVSGKIPYFITIKDGYVTNIEEVGAFSNFAGTNTFFR